MERSARPEFGVLSVQKLERSVMRKRGRAFLRDVGVALAVSSFLACGVQLVAQAPGPHVNSAPVDRGSPTLRIEVITVDVLTDTQGVDFSPYTKELSRLVSSAPDSSESKPSTETYGRVGLRVTVNRSGKITGMVLEQSTHDVQKDRAAWGAVTRLQSFPPLPASFPGESVSFRIIERVS
jgi:TonB family protein